MLKSLSFFGTVLAGGELTLACPRIGTRYRVKSITATFPLGCINLVQLSFFVSIDNDKPSTGRPSGTSLLQDYGQVDYLVGDDTKKRLEHEVDVMERVTYLKVHALNGDFNDHNIDVQMTIELID